MEGGVRLNEREYFRDHFTEYELRQILAGRHASEIFSRRSPSFRKLGLDFESLSGDDLIRLMVEEPRLIKRPLVRWGESLIAGSGKAERGAIQAALRDAD